MNESRVYQFGQSRLTLQFGDITKSEAQVIVSSDDHYLTMGGGVSAAILKAGGNAIALDASKKVPAALGDVVVTTAGTPSAQYIFHAVTIGPEGSNRDHEAVIRNTTERWVVGQFEISPSGQHAPDMPMLEVCQTALESQRLTPSRTLGA